MARHEEGGVSPEELDKARMMGRVDEIAQEAYRRRAEQTHPGHDIDAPTVIIAIELALSGWTPPPPVDPDRIAFEAWIKEAHPFLRDDGSLEEAYLAGARMAREQ
ncbi:MAG: hypothetical protein EBR62_03895, partial [Verrucomicrobia bacterium]|nr:hypothetical protein [Verrucomicrobiota bacterium]